MRRCDLLLLARLSVVGQGCRTRLACGLGSRASVTSPTWQSVDLDRPCASWLEPVAARKRSQGALLRLEAARAPRLSQALSVSRQRRCRLGRTPSNGLYAWCSCAGRRRRLKRDLLLAIGAVQDHVPHIRIRSVPARGSSSRLSPKRLADRRPGSG